MRWILLLVTICGSLFGFLFAGPYLHEVSPWLAGGVVIVGIFVTSYVKVKEREERLDRQVMQRRFPPNPRS